MSPAFLSFSFVQLITDWLAVELRCSAHAIKVDLFVGNLPNFHRMQVLLKFFDESLGQYIAKGEILHLVVV